MADDSIFQALAIRAAGLALLVALAYAVWLYMPSLKDLINGAVGGLGKIGEAVLAPILAPVNAVIGALEPVTDAIAAAIPAGARGWLPASAKDVVALPAKIVANPTGVAKAVVAVQPQVVAKAVVAVQPQVVAVAQVAKVVMPALPPGMRYNPARPGFIVDTAGNTLAQMVNGRGIASIRSVDGAGFRTQAYTVISPSPSGKSLQLTDAGRQILISLPGGKWASKAFKPIAGPAGDAARAALSKLTDAQKTINVGGVIQKADPRGWF